MNSIPSANSPCKICFTENTRLILENPSNSNEEFSQRFASGEILTLNCAPQPEGGGWFSLLFHDKPEGCDWVARGVDGSLFERMN